MVSVYPFVASLESSMRLYSRCLGSLARIGLESSVKKSEFEAKVSVTVGGRTGCLYHVGTPGGGGGWVCCCSRTIGWLQSSRRAVGWDEGRLNTMQQVVCAAFDPESTGSPGYPLIGIPVGVHDPHPPSQAFHRAGKLARWRDSMFGREGRQMKALPACN